jgi:hypothetical protein
MTPLPAPAAPPAPPLVPPEAHHAEAFGAEAFGADGHGPEDGPARAEPSYPPSESQVLFESWEAPHDPGDPWWDSPWSSELDELLAEPPARVPAGSPAGPALRREHGGGSGRRPGGAAWDGPRHARPERGRRRGHWGGAILALTGALAIAGAVPLGILGVRTLADRPAPTLTAAPLSDGSPISAPPSAVASAPVSAPASAPAGAPSQLSQGQTAAGPGPSASASASASASSSRSPGRGGAGAAKAATFALTAGPGCRALNGVIVFPFHAPAGDGWQPGMADRTGPCGASFSYSLLANVRNASGDWHDHYAWIFHTGKQVASCTLSLYVPPSAHANSSAFYWFSAGSDNPQNRMADFSVDQHADQGQWVTKGPFTFPGGTVLVELTDRGVGPVQDTVEAGVLQLRCV